MTLKEIIEKRKKLVDQSREIVLAADAEKRDLTSDEQERFDRLEAEITRLSKLKELEERQLRLEAGQAEIEDRERVRLAERNRETDPEFLATQRDTAFRAWLRQGIGTLTLEQRSVLQTQYQELPSEVRALAAGTDAAGGYTVPEGFANRIEVALSAFGGLLSVAQSWNTATGNDIPYPSTNDTANKGARLAENTQAGPQDVAFTSVTFAAYMYTSKIVKVSFQLLQDTGIDLEGLLSRLLAERIRRILEEECTTGTGGSMPEGVTVGATDSGITPPAAAGINHDNMVDILHTLDPAYRPNARWMFNDDTLAALRKVKTLEGSTAIPDYIWQQGMVPGAPDTVLGKPYTINQEMAGPGTSGNRAILIGDFSKYMYRNAGRPVLLRLTERYADYLQVGFLMFSRHDGHLVDAGTHPIVYADMTT